MQLSNHDLSQLSEEELLNLSEEELRRLSIKLLTDLKEARERLNQNSHNSSRPPSSEAGRSFMAIILIFISQTDNKDLYLILAIMWAGVR